MKNRINSIIKGIALSSLLLLVGIVELNASTNLTAEQALQKLKEGNARFVSGKAEYPNLTQARKTETATKGQHPYATIIGCSDSRVPIELAFDAGIGDIFVIRVAGNVVATDEAGSIEYGVEHLHTPLLVVLGHSSCGAVTAVAKNADVHGNIPALVDNIMPAVVKAKDKHGTEFSDELLEAAIQYNVWQSVEDLMKISPASAGLVKAGKLKIVGAVYHLDDGHVEWLGEHPNQAGLLASQGEKLQDQHAAVPVETSKTAHKVAAVKAGVGEVEHEEGGNKILFIMLILAGLVLAIYLLLINNSTAIKLNLRGKILSVAVSITLFLLALAGTSYYFLKGIGNEMESIAMKDIPLIEHVTKIEKNALQQEIALQKILTLAHSGFASNAKDIRELEEKFNQLSEHIDRQIEDGLQLCNQVLDHETDELQLREFEFLHGQLVTINKDHDDFHAHAQTLFDAVNNERLFEVGSLEHSLEEESEMVSQESTFLLDTLEKFTAYSAQVALAHEKDANRTSMIVSLISIVLGILLGILMANRISGQLGGEPEEVAELSDKIARGDLSFNIAAFGNRRGAIRNMLLMAEKLKEIVSNISTGAQNISSASQQVSSTSQQMSQGANEQASSVEEISSTLEEISANIQQNTDNSQQTEQISNDASKGISEVAERAKNAVLANQEIAEKIVIINDIAFQTNILALNAAVEAARAGEHGKGFAVVATEVRKLAERSKVAAEEIVGLAKKSLELAQGAGDVMGETIPKIQNTTKLVQEIAAASAEQSGGAGQVNGAVAQLNEVTQQNAAASEELATSAEELASQAEQLEDIIMFFNTGEIVTNRKVKNRTNTEARNRHSTKNISQNNGHEINLAGSSQKDEEYERF